MRNERGKLQVKIFTAPIVDRSERVVSVDKEKVEKAFNEWVSKTAEKVDPCPKIVDVIATETPYSYTLTVLYRSIFE